MIEHGEFAGEAGGHSDEDVTNLWNSCGGHSHSGGLYFGVGVAEGGDAAVYLQLGSPFVQGRNQR